ncbi:MAG: zinc ABC transporter substrate-binding protein [gamma proteobacterium symbiont of Bathyaustriella thionipta]|nr:zinc ABC transporter substrate-binding protein [gamma proteobacterium symbiont of Bathyaustriella thionipta]
MKSLLLILLYLGGLSSAQAALNIFSGEPEWAALAKELSLPDSNIYSATQGLQDPHHIQARPALIARLRSADLLIYSGAELEVGWLPLLLRRAHNAKVQAGKPGNLDASQTVRLREIPKNLDRAEGDIHASGNPHIQTDPRNILRVANEISHRLKRIDPEHSDAYSARLQDFTKRWKAAMQRWKQQGRSLRGEKVVVYHDQWVYLLHWLKMEQVATLEPKPGIPPTPGHLSELKAQMLASPARMILRAPFMDEKPGQWLSAQTGIPTITLPYTIGGDPQANDLFQLFDLTLQRLTAVQP